MKGGEMAKGPIFIGGCGSSGTTLLRKILNAHPNIAIGPEMSVFDRSAIYEKPFSYLQTAVLTDSCELFENGRVFYPLFNSDGSTYFGLAKGNNGPKHYHSVEAVRAAISGFDNTADFLSWYFRDWALQQGAKRWGEKTPNNVFFIREILSMFPDAVFIAMVRDPRDVVASMLTRRRESVGPWVQEAATVYRWNMAAASIWDGISNRIEILTYENLVSEPELYLKTIFYNIGEDYDPAVLDYWKHEDGDGKFDKEGADYAVSPITDRSVGRWKEFPDKQAMKRVELATAAMREKFGYE